MSTTCDIRYLKRKKYISKFINKINMSSAKHFISFLNRSKILFIESSVTLLYTKYYPQLLAVLLSIPLQPWVEPAKPNLDPVLSSAFPFCPQARNPPHYTLIEASQLCRGIFKIQVERSRRKRNPDEKFTLEPIQRARVRLLPPCTWIDMLEPRLPFGK